MIKQLNLTHMEQIEELFLSVFTKAPWFDDWSNKEQLHAYMRDLLGNPNSLAFGFMKEDKLIGIALGRIVHFYAGTEFFIDEFCISTKEQGRGSGSQFMREIQEALIELGIHHTFLMTERNVPAFEFYQKQGFELLENHVAFVKSF